MNGTRQWQWQQHQPLHAAPPTGHRMANIHQNTPAIPSSTSITFDHPSVVRYGMAPKNAVPCKAFAHMSPTKAQRPLAFVAHVNQVISCASHQQGGLHQQLGDHVWVQVGGGAAVLIVAALLHWHHAANTHRAAAVGHTPAEVMHGRRLVLASQATFVALLAHNGEQQARRRGVVKSGSGALC